MPTDNKSEIVIFKTADEKISVDVRFEGETVWLTQAQLVDLYGSSKANVSEHIKHIFEEEELEKDSVVRNFRHTQLVVFSDKFDSCKKYNSNHFTNTFPNKSEFSYSTFSP